MAEKRGTKALELWCKRMTEGYPGVKVENMTTSWRDGLAFCAIIHHFRPELIDFPKLNKEEVFYNNELAFTVAEKYLGIPALLEPEDMVEYDVPDRLSILTYLSQFYRTFVSTQGSSPARIVPKRPANSSDRGGSTSPASTSPPTKMALRSSGVPRREPCAKCGNPVYIAERLTVGKLLYHRTCFRCARCNSQLTLANYYETETPNQFCCETCPDEEKTGAGGGVTKSGENEDKSMLSRSLSDEEKSAGLSRLLTAPDEYSANFETALEDSIFKPSVEVGTSVYSKARSQFLSASFVEDGETPPELPKTKPPDIATPPSERNSKFPKTVSVSVSENVSVVKRTDLDKKTRHVTKDKSPDNVRKDDSVSSAPSLVKNRMKMFEKSPTDKEDETVDKKVPETLKRPLAETTIVPPEKRIPHDKQESALKSPLATRYETPSKLTSPKSPLATKYEAASKLTSQKSPRNTENVSFPKSEDIKSPSSKKNVFPPSTLDLKSPKGSKTTGSTPESISPKSPISHVRKAPPTSLNLALKSSKPLRSESTYENLGLKSSKTSKFEGVGLKSPKALKGETENTNVKPMSSPRNREATALKLSKCPVLEENPDSQKQSIKELAQTQVKSLNFLLQKQIALKEGKITPNSLINRSKADSSENLSKPKLSPTSTQVVKQKSMENLPTAKPRSITADDLAKSLLSNRKAVQENNIKSIPLVEKTLSASSEKISTSKSSLGSKYQSRSLDLGSNKELRSPILDKISPTSPRVDYKMKKQQSMEEIPKTKSEFTTKTFLSKNSKDGRKENVYQSPFKSGYHRDGLGLTSTNSRSTFMDYVSPYRRNSLESPLRSMRFDLDKSNKSRFGLYTSDSELNNILSRKPGDSGPSSPMRSIENLYRSNSEENIRSKDGKKPSDLVGAQQTRPSSVSALKNKFECLNVVESRPSIVTTTMTCLESDRDDVNRSLSEISHPDLSHGEILRDGHMSESVESPQNEIFEISDEKVDTPIIVDLIEDSTPESVKNDVITISDESIIEISDSSSFNQISGISEETKSKKIEYPEDLNPFGDEEVSQNDKNSKKDSLNPFDDEDEDLAEPKPTPAVRKKIIVPLLDIHEGDTPEYMRGVYIQRISVNPFEEEDDEERQDEDMYEQKRGLGQAAGLPKKVISAPRISLNPFWSDADEDEPEDDEDDHPRPVPKPRRLRNPCATSGTPEPKPRTGNQSLGIGGAVSFGSNSSLSSGQSGGQSVRKKKPAPRPPIHVTEAKNESPNESSLTSSPNTSVSHSPRLPVKSRKTRKAPLPPTSTPHLKISAPTELTDLSPIPNCTVADPIKPEDGEESQDQEEWNSEKDAKDKVNENRRSQIFSPPNLVLTTPGKEFEDYVPNKSTYGKWKRKKGPAPSRPVPERRMIKALAVCELRKELDLIELQKQGLEKQGVRLEQIIRDRCESPEPPEQTSDVDEDNVPIDVEDLILQLFEVVNEKNELSRREAELMYLQRQQKLEEEHAEVEYQIRCSMMQPELNKTDSDKAKEEELIQRLVEIVERRNEIIECLEMDRLREAEEDDSISTSLNSYASRRDELAAGSFGSLNLEVQQNPDGTLSKKEKSKKPKKDKKKKKSDLMDADKDVDESESSLTSITKEKKKKKFALF